MLRYTTDRARPGLVALYNIRPGNGVGQILQPWSPHEASVYERYGINCREKKWWLLWDFKVVNTEHIICR